METENALAPITQAARLIASHPMVWLEALGCALLSEATFVRDHDRRNALLFLSQSLDALASGEQAAQGVEIVTVGERGVW